MSHQYFPAGSARIKLAQQIDQTDQALTVLRKGIDEAYRDWSTRQTELDNVIGSSNPLDTDAVQRKIKMSQEQQHKVQLITQQTKLCIQESRRLRSLRERLDIMDREQNHKRLVHKWEIARIDLQVLQIESERNFVKDSSRVRLIEEMEITSDFGTEDKVKLLVRANARMERHHTFYQRRIISQDDYVMDLEIRVQSYARNLKDRKRAWEESNVIDN
ncbi:hypothetical protein G7Y79_00026g059420 [Physcia stellaris]|nr:hypothetical protein G7Y79_00026g059420 [Physcia stellaris]